MKLLSRQEELSLLEEANKRNPPVRHTLGHYYSKLFYLVEQDERGSRIAASPGSCRIKAVNLREDC